MQNGVVYIYASELAKVLKKAWKKTKLYVREEEVPALPADEPLRRLLDVAYHASLLTEESRQPSFRVVFCPRSEFGSVSNPRVRSCVKIDFDRPQPFNEKQLLQLAPATDPTSVLIAVEPVTAEDGTVDLQIWGLLDTGSSWWAHMRRETERTIHSPPDLLTISSNRPGRISVSRAWRVLLTLENGRLVSPAADLFVNSPVAAEFEEPTEKLYERVYAGYETADPYEPMLNRYNCGMKYISCIKRLLTYFQDKRHGGIVLLLPDDSDAKEGFDQLVEVKYSCRHYELWTKLRGVLELKRKWFELSARIAAGNGVCERGDVAELGRLRNAVDEQEHQLTDGLQVIAALTGVDGAVVLTDRLRLVGFGAELRAKARLPVVYRASDPLGVEREATRPESFGTRHRSAFRFCAEHPRGLAFVHSQDGGLRVVKRVGDDVVFWDVHPAHD